MPSVIQGIGRGGPIGGDTVAMFGGSGVPSRGSEVAWVVGVSQHEDILQGVLLHGGTGGWVWCMYRGYWRNMMLVCHIQEALLVNHETLT